ncbi:11195_t:CDS:2, partial [Gigaspora margarita]
YQNPVVAHKNKSPVVPSLTKKAEYRSMPYFETFSNLEGNLLEKNQEREGVRNKQGTSDNWLQEPLTIQELPKRREDIVIKAGEEKLKRSKQVHGNGRKMDVVIGMELEELDRKEKRKRRTYLLDLNDDDGRQLGNEILNRERNKEIHSNKTEAEEMPNEIEIK